jgi:hypothetical protein
MAKLDPTHDELKARSELAAELIPDHIWDGIHRVNKRSNTAMTSLWQDNIRSNLEAHRYDLTVAG